MAEETKVEEKEVKVPTKFKDIVKTIEEMTVLDLSELVKVLEEKFGVSASAPMMMAGPAAGAAAAEEVAKTNFDVELTSIGEQKIAVIKAVKEVTGLGLKEAKDLVDKAPAMIKENLPKAEAEELKSKIEAAGASVTLK